VLARFDGDAGAWITEDQRGPRSRIVWGQEEGSGRPRGWEKKIKKVVKVVDADWLRVYKQHTKAPPEGRIGRNIERTGQNKKVIKAVDASKSLV
jgi:hypothetical protein